jgi:hypothetical protein
MISCNFILESRFLKVGFYSPQTGRSLRETIQLVGALP